MKTHPRLTGLFLLLISIGFFFAIDFDKGFDALKLCGFLLCFVSGWLVLTLFGKDGDITTLRRIHKEKNQGRAIQAMYVQEMTFRYSAMKGWRLVVMVCLYIFMLAMAIGFLYLLIINESGDATTIEALYFVFGLFASFLIFFCWITWRYIHLFIKIEGKGITASTYFGMKYSNWDDIVALRVRIPRKGWGVSSYTFYKIYTLNHMISFSSGMPGVDELVKLISETTGFDWKGKA